MVLEDGNEVLLVESVEVLWIMDRGMSFLNEEAAGGEVSGGSGHVFHVA